MAGRWERDPMRSDTSVLRLRPAEDREADARAARGNLAALVCERHGVDPARADDPAAVLAAAEEYADLCGALGMHVAEPPARPQPSRPGRFAKHTQAAREASAAIDAVRTRHGLDREGEQ